MKRLPLRLMVPAAALLAVFLLTTVYVYQNFLGGSISQRPTTVTVQLEETGGLFERSSVTYRGVKVGRVVEIRTTETGVEAEIAIDAGVEVPSSARAVVRNLSPAGEQFLDLQPEDDEGAVLADGDVIPTDRTDTPTTVAESLQAIDTLMSQIDPEDLRVTLDELSVAFADPDDLATVVDSGQEILASLDTYWPETERIITGSATVLRTGVDLGPQLRTLAPAANRLTGWLAAYDPKLRSMLETTPAQVTELRAFTSTVAMQLPAMLTTMGEFTDMTLPYRPHLWQFLADVPQGFSDFATTITGGRLHAVMLVDTRPGAEAVCRYVPDGSATDPSPVVVDPTRACTSEFGLQQRGSANAPGPVGVLAP
ncbi:MCE family protein [Aeromicrobium sp. Leaf350]|uniref:MCE family protein n=1 Tax=Aeromicrobium sp. Leaf350 TaxID=2876565 RepID=UPI001E30249B|nr:MlaD family protein [Aeromicrobium sp. Leaf350]